MALNAGSTGSGRRERTRDFDVLDGRLWQRIGHLLRQSTATFRSVASSVPTAQPHVQPATLSMGSVVSGWSAVVASERFDVSVDREAFLAAGSTVGEGVGVEPYHFGVVAV